MTLQIAGVEGIVELQDKLCTHNTDNYTPIKNSLAIIEYYFI